MGRSQVIEISPMSGLSNVKHWLKSHGYDPEDEVLCRRLLEGLGGIEYNAGCWVFRAVFQRLQASTQVASTGFFFQLELSGLGSLGTGETVDVLKRSVAGYAVTNPSNPSLVPPSLRPKLPFDQVF